jgi:gamma-glutamyltranspeptidase/glutathione hydrolase
VIALAGVAALSACDDGPPPGQVATEGEFAGLVVADEPHSVVVAEKILKSNGNAVDAAVAAYFTLAVTLPSRAGLGGGGVCVVYDPVSTKAETFEFLLHRPASGGRAAVPGNVRGFAALHSRYGSQRWEQILSPAETLARTGYPMSRALDRDLEAAAGVLNADTGMHAVFLGTGDKPRGEGDLVTQVPLAALIGRIRATGVSGFYGGEIAQRLASESTAVGLPLTVDDLRAAVPKITATVQVPVGKHTAFFASPPAAGGLTTAQIWMMLTAARDISSTPAEERTHLQAEAFMRAFADRSVWMQPDGSANRAAQAQVAAPYVERLMASYDSERHTPADSLQPPPTLTVETPYTSTFAVMDRHGQAVSCGVSENALFGSGRFISDLGLVLPAPDDPEEGFTSMSLGPVVIANNNSHNAIFAGASSGGTAGPTALASVMARTIALKQPLEEAVGARRIHHNGVPDVVWHEPGLSEAVLASLTRRGYEERQTPVLGWVNAIYCPGGVPRDEDTCVAVSDPRGNGLARRVE